MLFALPVLWAWTRHLASRRDDGRSCPPCPSGSSWRSCSAASPSPATWRYSIFLSGATDIANASFISNIAPILVVIGGAVFYRESPRQSSGPRSGLALFGSWMMAGLLAPAALGRGDLFALGAALFYSAYLLIMKQVRTRLDGPAATFWTAAISAIVLVACGAAVGRDVPAPAPSRAGLLWRSWASVSHAAGQGLTSIAVGRVPVGLVAIVMPDMGADVGLLAWVIFDEQLNALQVWRRGGHPRRAGPRTSALVARVMGLFYHHALCASSATV